MTLDPWMLHRARDIAAMPLAWRSALVLLAGIAVIAQWLTPLDLTRAPPPLPVAPATPPPVAAPAAAIPVPAFPAIAEHPLFYPSRKPWLPPAPPPAAPPAASRPLAGYALTGVIVSDKVHRALVRVPTGDKVVTVTEGQAFDGWTLREIRRSGLHFEREGATYDLGFPEASR
jgi:hypothetical protein